MSCWWWLLVWRKHPKVQPSNTVNKSWVTSPSDFAAWRWIKIYIWPNYNISPSPRFPWNSRGYPFQKTTFWGPRSCYNLTRCILQTPSHLASVLVPFILQLVGWAHLKHCSWEKFVITHPPKKNYTPNNQLPKKKNMKAGRWCVSFLREVFMELQVQTPFVRRGFQPDLGRDPMILSLTPPGLPRFVRPTTSPSRVNKVRPLPVIGRGKWLHL